MRSAIKFIFIAVLVVLGLAWASLASFAAGDAGGADLEQACSDYSIPCSDPSVHNCVRCLPSVSTPSDSAAPTATATPSPVVTGGGGTYGPGGVKLEADGTFRFATEEEIVALNQLLAQVTNEMPEPSLERDRRYAEVLGENGFVFDQLQLTQIAANEGGLALHPEDAVTIMQLYEQIGLPEIAVDYGAWANARLPAYTFRLIGDQYYVDPWAEHRVNIFTAAQSTLRLNSDLPGTIEQAEAIGNTLNTLEDQLDLSQLEGFGIVLLQVTE